MKKILGICLGGIIYVTITTLLGAGLDYLIADKVNWTRHIIIGVGGGIGFAILFPLFFKIIFKRNFFDS